MLRIRTLDERMLARQRQGKVGFYGTIPGRSDADRDRVRDQEEDWIFPRCARARSCSRGFPLVMWLAQVYGTPPTCSQGRQHAEPHERARVTGGVVRRDRPQSPQAVGAAFAAKLKKDPIVVVASMGDGATSEPDFHAGMNSPGVWQVPGVLVCQNNHWSISVPTSRQTGVRRRSR